MNSKERVSAALEQRQADKVTLGLYTVDHDIIEKVIGRPTYVRNKVALYKAFYIENRRDEVVESMKQDVVDFYKKLDCVDLLTLKEAMHVPPEGFKPEKSPRKIDDNTYEDAHGVWKLEEKHNDVMLVDRKDNELKIYDVGDFADRTIPEPIDESSFELSDYLIKHFRQDRYILGYSAGITALTLLGDTENGLMTMALQPDVIKACNEQRVFMQSHNDQYFIRPGVDGVMFEQDMAGTNAPLVSPEMFRELCFPYLKQRVAQVKKHVPHVVLHNCGNNMLIMDMLVESGIDAYESIQTTTRMSIRNLAGKYGQRLCIWGAVPLEILIGGTRDDTRKAVRQCFEDAVGTNGFILGPSHSIAFGTKYGNFMTMLDEFVKLRDRFW